MTSSADDVTTLSLSLQAALLRTSCQTSSNLRHDGTAGKHVYVIYPHSFHAAASFNQSQTLAYFLFDHTTFTDFLELFLAQ
jgi:hypothetical protein